MSAVEYQRPPIRVALMGLGRTLFEEHYPILKAHPDLFQVVAACDLQRDRRNIIEKDFPKCRMFRQYEDMLDERDIDVVDITTPTADHVNHAMMALDRRIWTILESPLATTEDEARLLRGAISKAKGHFLPLQRGIFAPDFLLARQAMLDVRLGEIYSVSVRQGDYIRRDDWQTIKRLGGGACYYAMTDLLMQVLKLLPMPPFQMWSDLKRVTSLGDSEDYVAVNFKTRGLVSADLIYNGGVLAPCREPSFTIRGSLGEFRVNQGAHEGKLTIVDPEYKFPRRRSSVRTPTLDDLHEDLKIVEIPLVLPEGALCGGFAFWKCVYNTVRTGEPFPVQLEDAMTALRYAQLMKAASPFNAKS